MTRSLKHDLKIEGRAQPCEAASMLELLAESKRRQDVFENRLTAHRAKMGVVMLASCSCRTCLTLSRCGCVLLSLLMVMAIMQMLPPSTSGHRVEVLTDL